MAAKTVEQLVEDALDAFDDPGMTVTSHVRRAIRIASESVKSNETVWVSSFGIRFRAG